MPELKLVRPLEWPPNIKRKTNRRGGGFSFAKKPITVTAAIERLEGELGRFGARDAEISAEFGVTRGGNVAREWKGGDPGVCIRFDVGKTPYTLPCDEYSQLPQNIAALTAHIEAVRAIERHGVATTAQMMGAFAQLPGRGGTGSGSAPWHEVLGLLPTATLGLAEAAYRVLAKHRHPDAGGSESAMAELNNAIQEARELLRK